MDHDAIKASLPGDYGISATLTDAEREAIEYAASSLLGRDKPFGWPVPLEIQQRARLLRGLVARLSRPAT